MCPLNIKLFSIAGAFPQQRHWRGLFDFLQETVRPAVLQRAPIYRPSPLFARGARDVHDVAAHRDDFVFANCERIVLAKSFLMK